MALSLQLFSYSFSAMASACSLYFYAKSETQANKVVQAIVNETSRIEQKYSRYLSNSYLSQINSCAQKAETITVDRETAYLLNCAEKCYRISDRLFDVTSGRLRKIWNFSTGDKPDIDKIKEVLPTIGWDKVQWQDPSLSFKIPGIELDFGGLGKEYAVDQAMAIGQQMGIHHGLVDYGGDIGIIGPHPHTGEAWEICIQNPNLSETPIQVVSITHGALASSGGYERFIELEGKRYTHLLNPETGWPVEGLLAVSVIDPDSCLNAGMQSTIAMLKGDKGITWLEENTSQYLWVDAHGNSGGTLMHPQL